MRFCGISSIPTGHLQLATLEEVLTDDPPVRLIAGFYQPATAEQVAAVIAALGDTVVAVAAPAGRDRACDRLLAARGVAPADPSEEAGRLYALLTARFAPEGDATEGPVPEGAYQRSAVIETNADGVFCSLQGRRLPARRHPFGVQLRLHELGQDRVTDEGGDLWHRRIEEIDAAGAALCAHRYAVGHASYLGDPGEGVIVLPGSSLPEAFPTEGVLPEVQRLPVPATR